MHESTDWNGLYRDHVIPLYRFVSRRVGGDRELAEDVTQETWLRAIDSWKKKGAPREPDAWLSTVAGNLLRNHFRRQRPSTWSQAEDEPAQDPDQAEIERAAQVQWGLSRLRAAQARLLEAHHFDGLTIATMAKAAGLSERAVEGRLHRARAALRALLGGELLNHPDQS